MLSGARGYGGGDDGAVEAEEDGDGGEIGEDFGCQ